MLHSHPWSQRIYRYADVWILCDEDDGWFDMINPKGTKQWVLDQVLQPWERPD